MHSLQINTQWSTKSYQLVFIGLMCWGSALIKVTCWDIKPENIQQVNNGPLQMAYFSWFLHTLHKHESNWVMTDYWKLASEITMSHDMKVTLITPPKMLYSKNIWNTTFQSSAILILTKKKPVTTHVQFKAFFSGKVWNSRHRVKH